MREKKIPRNGAEARGEKNNKNKVVSRVAARRPARVIHLRRVDTTGTRLRNRGGKEWSPKEKS